MPVIPWPAQYETSTGHFSLPEEVYISYAGEGTEKTANLLREQLEDRLQLSCSVAPASDIGDSAAIHLARETEAVASLASAPNQEEGYELNIREAQVVIRGNEPHGVFNGVQTLLQMLPAFPAEGGVSLDCVTIVDYPRFKWRGVLLDVGRHYFEVPFILKLLDVMAFHKMNRFHWHLTEDQGWRLEVKAYPILTQKGAWRGRGPAKPYGGFYTQDEVRTIIQYAAERFILVVPEIELPGHSCAAIACYPHLSCTERVTQVPVQWGIHEDVYCAGKEETFEFLQTVLTEVIDLFPGTFIHIGGDECPKVRWNRCKRCQERIRAEGLEDEYQLQSWFIRRIGAFLKSHNRRLIGWDEILEGGLAPDAIVMSWRGITGGVRAAKAGHDVIMTPASHTYLDYRQSLRSDEPGAWYAMLPLEISYAFDPIPPEPDMATPMSRSSLSELDGDDAGDLAFANALDLGSTPLGCDRLDDDWTLPAGQAHHILGGQANVWTEYIGDQHTLEYMLLPRLCALSEALWSPKPSRDWQGFQHRLKSHLRHLDAMGMRYRPLG